MYIYYIYNYSDYIRLELNYTYFELFSPVVSLSDSFVPLV